MTACAGAHKNTLKEELVRNGATVISDLTANVTHLIVASPSAPHSQTPPSDKLLQARRNANRLHPRLSVVWEGWVSATISCGGVRSNVTAQYEWREGMGNPDYVSPAKVDVTASHGQTPRCGAHAQEEEPPEAGTDTCAERTSTRARSKDSSLMPSVESSVSTRDRKNVGHDAHGYASLAAVRPDDARILKKRRLANPRADPADLGIHATWGLRDSEHVELDALPAVGHTEGQDMQTTRTTSRTAVVPASEPPRPSTRSHDASGTVIRALGERRNGVWTDRDSHPPAKTDVALATPGLSAGPRSDAALRRDNGAGASDNGRQVSIFRGQTFALVNLKGPNPSKLAGVIALYGGRAVIDPVGEGLSAADWIVVDYVE